MTLSCGDVSLEDVADQSEPPRVDWYFYEYEKYRRLNCSTFWNYVYQNDVCRARTGKYPRFEGPASYPCSLSADSKSYRCEYSHPDIIPLKYKCVITSHGKEHREIEKVKIIYVIGNKNSKQYGS